MQVLAILLPALPAGVQLATAGPPEVTSLTNKATAHHLPAGNSVGMRRGPIWGVVVDNSAVGSEHREGCNGIAVLSHKKRRENRLVPLYSGLNLEVIHDETNASREVLFEPRRAPMEPRVVNRHTAELYQAPTPNWRLESCTRLELERDGTVRMVFECIPRARGWWRAGTVDQGRVAQAANFQPRCQIFA